MNEPVSSLADVTGRAADTLDNLLQAMTMPLPAELHLKMLRGSLMELSATLKEAVIAETGDDPWET